MSFPDIQQTIRRNFANLSRLMSELYSFKYLKLYSLNFAIAHAQIKTVMLRPIKKIVVFQVPCQKKTGSVGRLYFFFFFLLFFSG